VPEPEHLAVASRCLVFVAHQMQGAVRSQEGDLRLEGPPAPPGLPPGPSRADQDVAHAKHAVIWTKHVEGSTNFIGRPTIPLRE